MSPTRTVAGDVVSGAVVALVCLPFCIGFGLIALQPLGPEHAAFGMQAGLCGGIAGGLVASVLGGTRGQISAPIIAGALLIADLLGVLATDPRLPAGFDERFAASIGLVGVTVCMSGVLQVAFGAVRLGALARYLAYPVVAGLMAAVAVLTAKGQLVEFLGPGGVRGWSARPFSPAALATSLTGIVTLAAIAMSGRVLPRVPGPLTGIVAGVVLGHALPLVGGPGLGVPMLAAIPTAVPHVVDPLPALHLLQAPGGGGLLRTLFGPALSIALFSSLNSLLASSSVDAMSGERHDANRELLGQGCGNIAASLFAGLPGGGLASLSTLNWRSGGRTRLAGVTYGLTLLAFLLAGGPIVARIPRVVLAAVVVFTAVRLVDPWIVRLVRAVVDPARRADRADSVIHLALVAAVLGTTLAGGLVDGILVGVVATSALFIVRTGRVRYRLAYRGDEGRSKRARPLDDLDVLAKEGRSISVFELAGPIFFGSADALIDRIARDAAGAQTIIVGLRGVDEIDASGLRVLVQFVARAAREGRRVLLAHLTPAHPLWTRLADMGVRDDEIGRHCFASTDAALEWAEDRVLEAARKDAARAPAGARVSSPGGQGDVRALAETDLLRGLPGEALDWFDANATRRTFPRGATIFRAGDGDRSLYVLVAGSVNVVASANGGPGETAGGARLASFAAGTVFGEIALLDGQPRSATVVADEDATCVVLSAETFDALRRERPELALRVLENLSLGLARRLRASTEQIHALLADEAI